MVARKQRKIDSWDKICTPPVTYSTYKFYLQNFPSPPNKAIKL
jgi:hypothetical protein